LDPETHISTPNSPHRYDWRMAWTCMSMWLSGRKKSWLVPHSGFWLPWTLGKQQKWKVKKPERNHGGGLSICQLQMVYLLVYGNLCMMYIANSTKKNWKELSKMGGSKAGGEIAPNRSSPMMRGLKTPNTFWGSVFEPPNAQLQNGFYMI